MSELWVVQSILLWIVVAGLALLQLGILRQLGLIQLRLGTDPGALITNEGLPRGVEAPDFTATDVRSLTPVHLRALQGRPKVLIFLSPTCLACKELIPHLNAVARERKKDFHWLIVCYGTMDSCAQFGRLYEVQPPIISDVDNSIGERYIVHSTPYNGPVKSILPQVSC